MNFDFKQEYLAIVLPSISDDLCEDLSQKLSEFVYWQRSQLDVFHCLPNDIEFLGNQGLPKICSPYLGFQVFEQDDILQIQQDNDLRNLDFPIGLDGSGNIIFLDTKLGKVHLSDHDNYQQKTFINSPLEQLAQCICAYSKGHQTINDLDVFQTLDNQIGQEKDFWQMELL